MKYLITALGFLSLSSVHAYDVIERYKIIEDKLKTEAMLRPIDHDFFFDISASVNKNLTDVIDDVDKANKSQNVNEANAVLLKYDKTEQTLKASVNLGFPLPSFTAWEVKFKPNFKVLVDLGANIGIRNKILNNQDLINLFKDQIPTELQSFLSTLDLVANAGQDIRTLCLADFPSGPVNAFCTSLPAGKFIIPNTSSTNPTLSLLAKGDAKAGFFNEYTYGEHFFGQFNLYGMGRADLYQFITGTQIAKGESIESPKNMNTEITLQTDYRLGYKNTNYTVFASAEEVKLAKIDKRKTDSKAQTYGYDALLRVHADATYRLANFLVQVFSGVHKRSGYGISEGLYAGVTTGAHVFSDRLGIQLRGMVDKEYITLTPRFKLWLMQLEYSLKTPIKNTVDDVKLTAIHSVDFRIFF